MDEVTQTPPGSPGGARRWLWAGGLLAAGTLLGGVLAGTMSASAASNGSTTAPSAPSGAGSGPGSAGGTAPAGQPPTDARSATPVRPDEKALSAADAAKVKAAALAAVPGGTVYRVETDAGDGAYEAHMTKADGTLVTVKLDASFAVTKVEAGMGSGDPALQRPSSSSSSSTGTSSP
jgi:hypothetical protein